jgi:hypothetical protein
MTKAGHKRSVIGRMDEKNVILPVWISDRPIAPEPMAAIGGVGLTVADLPVPG